MTANVPARHRQPVDRDPDRRLPAPEHPGYAPFERGTTVMVCIACSACIPANDADADNHVEHHRKNDYRGTR